MTTNRSTTAWLACLLAVLGAVFFAGVIFSPPPEADSIPDLHPTTTYAEAPPAVPVPAFTTQDALDAGCTEDERLLQHHPGHFICKHIEGDGERTAPHPPQ